MPRKPGSAGSDDMDSRVDSDEDDGSGGRARHLVTSTPNKGQAPTRGNLCLSPNLPPFTPIPPLPPGVRMPPNTKGSFKGSRRKFSQNPILASLINNSKLPFQEIHP